MKNRFKFRAWFKPDFETEDGPLKFEQKEIRGELFFVHDGIEYPFSIPFEDDDWIVEQWTSLLDEKGKEVYEGDIISYINYKGEVVESPVLRDGPEFCPLDINGEEGASNDLLLGEPLIIGNIHENPEPL